MEQIQIIDAKKHIGEIVQIGAWVANKRSSGKIAFLQLRDGTAYFQGIVVKNEVGEEILGILTIQLKGEQDEVIRAINYIQKQDVKIERVELNYD